MKKYFGLYCFFMLFFSQKTIAQQSDSVHEKMFSIGVEANLFLLKKSDHNTKTKQGLSFGGRIPVVYKFNNSLGLSSGLGFHVGSYYREVFFKNFLYAAYNHNFIDIHFPLLFQYYFKDKKNILYTLETGMGADYIINEIHQNQSLLLMNDDVLKNGFAVSIPIGLGMQYNLKSKAKIAGKIYGTISNYWSVYYGFGVGIIFK